MVKVSNHFNSNPYYYYHDWFHTKIFTSLSLSGMQQKKLLLYRHYSSTRVGGNLLIFMMVFLVQFLSRRLKYYLKSLHHFLIFVVYYILVIFNFSTGKIVVILLIYPHYFPLTLSNILFEHQTNSSTATAVIAFVSDNGQSFLSFVVVLIH